MVGLLIIIIGLLVTQSHVWVYAFNVGGYERLYKITFGFAIIFSISYVIWIMSIML